MLASRARRASKDRYNAFVSVVRDTRREARAGDLSSWRVAVKDNICTKQFPTTCSSEILRGRVIQSHPDSNLTKQTFSRDMTQL
jgi:Asp-tRNA(Asn)/Glu-tRNA(Gln) amidotransferase A subunit family amidase